jgi:glucose/arabinose dehydrogenase
MSVEKSWIIRVKSKEDVMNISARLGQSGFGLARFAGAWAAALLVTNTWAQAPAAAPAAPPSWQQGRSAEQASSTLHPFAPHFTGRAASDLPLDKLKVPPGFKVEVWVEGVPEARSLVLGDKGTVFVSNRNLADVYAIVDRGGKREIKKIFTGMKSPNGIAFSKGTLYVAERHRITRYDGIEDKLDSPPEAKVVIDNLDPSSQPGHFWKYLAMGPTASCISTSARRAISCCRITTRPRCIRVDPNSGVLETVALGVRNSVGMDWHPRTKELCSPITPATGSATICLTTRCIVLRAKTCTLATPSATRATCWIRNTAKAARARNSTRRQPNWDRTIAPLGMRFLHRANVPRGVSRQSVYRHARLVEPLHQARLQRHARDLRRFGQNNHEAVSRRVPHRRKRRSADVGPSGRRVGNA